MTVSAKKIIHTTVFQNGPNGGNPCPLVVDGDGLSADDGKRLATRFGAETVLVLQPVKDDADFKLRYFVPQYEMEMCVHGTIAAATVLRKYGFISKTPITIETMLGEITVEWQSKGEQIQVTVYQFRPQFSDLNPTIEEACSALRVSANEIDLSLGPIVSVSTSRSKLMIPIRNEEILDDLRPDFEMLWDLCDRYDTTGFYPFARSSKCAVNDFSARQFPKRAGYHEDPATGVAACALGSYLALVGKRRSGWHFFNVHQGNAMGRPSLLNVGAWVENNIITRTSVSGKAAVLGEEEVSFG